MKTVLVYDVNVLPNQDFITTEKLFEIYEEVKILFWDSKGATPGVNCTPQVHYVPKDTPISILDINSEEGKATLEKYKK